MEKKFIELADFKEMADTYYKNLTKLAKQKGIGSMEHIYFNYGIEWAYNHLPQSENERLKADNEILLNALKPLVNLAKEVFIDSRKDKTGTLYGFNKAEITYNDLRTALEAIKQAENK